MTRKKMSEKTISETFEKVLKRYRHNEQFAIDREAKLHLREMFTAGFTYALERYGEDIAKGVAKEVTAAVMMDFKGEVKTALYSIFGELLTKKEED